MDQGMSTRSESGPFAAGRRGGKRTGIRWVVIVMGALGTAIAYVDRANLSVAMPFIRHGLHFGPALEGVILSSFFWTYALFQLPSGWLIDRIGPRVVFAASAAWWGVFTAATAAARGVGSLLGFRLALGAGEGPMMPSNAKVVAEWFPRQERGLASGIFNSGTEGGSAVSIAVCTALIAWGGWKFSFVFTGGLGLIWGLCWVAFYRSPRRHRWASAAEVAYIEAGGGAAGQAAAEGRPAARPLAWRDLLRYRTVWGMILAYICRSMCVYFFITWFPSYLSEARHLNLAEIGILGSIPGICSICANWIGGWFCDFLLRRGAGLSLARKIPLVGGMLGAAVIALAGFASSTGLALAILTISYSFSSFSGGAVWALPADVAPAPGNVASISGLQNFGSQIGGITGPIIVGFLVAMSGGFILPLVAMGCVTVIGAIIYAFMVEVKPLPVPGEPCLLPVR
jgi:MFS family permease